MKVIESNVQLRILVMDTHKTVLAEKVSRVSGFCDIDRAFRKPWDAGEGSFPKAATVPRHMNATKMFGHSCKMEDVGGFKPSDNLRWVGQGGEPPRGAVTYALRRGRQAAFGRNSSSFQDDHASLLVL